MRESSQLRALTAWRTSSGGEAMARELMAITGLTAQQLVALARSACASAGGIAAAAAGTSGRLRNDVDKFAEAVMGRDAWDTYKNSEYKSMKGPRAPAGSVHTRRHVAERKKKLGGSMTGWSLQQEPAYFEGEDTLWNMDDTLTWLPPNGDVNGAHVETLGNMISEAFHNYKNSVSDKKRNDAKKAAKKSSTAAEASEWVQDTSVRGIDFFKTKK